MRHLYSLSLCALILTSVSAKTITINDFRYSSPIAITQSVALGDTTGLSNDIDYLNLPFYIDDASLSDNPEVLPGKSLMTLIADFENRSFTNAEIKVEGIDKYTLLLDGNEVNGNSTLMPMTHRLALKYIASSDSTVNPQISITTDNEVDIVPVTDHKRMYTLADVMYGTRINDVSLSPSGNYLLISYSDTRDGGKTNRYQRLYDVKSGKFVATINNYASWLYNSDRYVVERTDYQHGRHIVAINPATGEESVLCANLPDGNYMISPTEDFLIFSMVRQGPKEDPEIYRVIEPEDRQPGWRDRVYPAIYRFDNPILLPLGTSNQDLRPIDISKDGSKVLLMSTKRRMTKRPTTLFSLISLDLNTHKCDTIVADDGFISEAAFSPDGKSIIVVASPEAFDRVGCTLPTDVIPSAYDYQLYSVNIDNHQVTPLTRDFNPSINSFLCNNYDGKIYVTSTERDMYTLYAIDPATGKISPIITPDNVLKGIDCAASTPIMVVYGQSDSSPDAAYLYDIKKGKFTLIDTPSSDRLSDVRLGKCIDWTCLNEKGDTVYARYYLPDNFDPEKKYPLIVNYYGGCTPSTRTLESRYPMHVYSSLGYITLVIQPSGCTGFGQEWSSRHVSTAGRVVAEDIISATEQFCQNHPFVNSEKIGCIGASYGGFMTQYLLTQTPMFATAISHAGISDHTSYWGEGYWGYSYSEVSMGDDMPWTNPDLYVGQSPLYNADKIRTPILFLHGDVDTNVPVGESIQMFTALKLLGQDAVLVEVSGQNHHILDDSKRKKWQNTIFAWFAKYLQDDPTWWESLYPSNNL